MNRRTWQALVVALVALFIGVAGTAAVLAYIPDSGSAPSIYDDFNWNSIANGFWHVNSYGTTTTVKNSVLTIAGDSVELDRRVQTDPKETLVVAKMRGNELNRFGLGLGVYHAGTIGMEFDSDGLKCGRGTDHGYKVDFLRGWTTPPIGQWFYLAMGVINPYPTSEEQAAADKLDSSKQKKIGFYCALFDSHGRLLNRIKVTSPPPNTHYPGLDEAYLRIWDDHNNYQLDWIYVGPVSGNPMSAAASDVLR